MAGFAIPIEASIHMDLFVNFVCIKRIDSLFLRLVPLNFEVQKEEEEEEENRQKYMLL